jgi:hypothetical protein
MTPSNPVRYFVTGSDTREFRYGAGPTPFYAIGRSKGYIHFSLLVFAHSEEHVRQILEDMLVFAKVCHDEYARYKLLHDAEDRHDFVDRNDRHLYNLTAAVHGAEGYTLTIDRADTGQLYKIGWASNDTI